MSNKDQLAERRAAKMKAQPTYRAKRGAGVREDDADLQAAFKRHPSYKAKHGGTA